MPVAMWSRPGARGPVVLQSGQKADIFRWAPTLTDKTGKDPVGGIDFEEIVRIVVQHQGTTQTGSLIEVFRSYGAYRDLVASFRICNANAVVDVRGPLTAVESTATQLGSGADSDRIEAFAIARTEGR